MVEELKKVQADLTRGLRYHESGRLETAGSCCCWIGGLGGPRGYGLVRRGWVVVA